MLGSKSNSISVVTPTFRRPAEVRDLLKNLSEQTLLPSEVILVDGTDEQDTATREMVEEKSASLPFKVCYFKHANGTAIQRNAGIEKADGDFIAFIDDDIRLSPNFFELMIAAFLEDADGAVGGIAGYITNQHLDPDTSPRWKWYRRLRLFSTYEPGRYDFTTGYPINRYLQAPHEELRSIDFMGAGCALWRRDVFEKGLRFSAFFSDFGMLEDAHFALRARRDWVLLELGRARCTHLRSQAGRVNKRQRAWKTAVNYRYVFVDLVPERTRSQEFRFWRVQAFDLFRQLLYAARTRCRDDWLAVIGKVEGIAAARRITSGSSKG